MVVKALINLLGIYPVGTCVILDAFEVAVVTGPSSDAQLNRPQVRIAVDVDGAIVPVPGTAVSLSEKDESGAYKRSIVKVTNPSDSDSRLATTLSDSRLTPVFTPL